MDEAFLLQAIGRLYLEKESLRVSLTTQNNKDIEINALKQELAKLHSQLTKGVADESTRKE